MKRKSYAMRKLLLVIPLFLGTSFIIFTLVCFHMQQGSISYPLSSTDYIKSIYGLDHPWYVQYLYWLKEVVTGNLGFSLLSGKVESAKIITVTFITLLYQLTGIILSLILGIPLGIMSAIKQHSRIKPCMMTGALLGGSVPLFFSGLLIRFLFSFILGWFPEGGIHSQEFLEYTIPHNAGYYADYLNHLVLPSLTVALAGMFYIAHLVKLSMLHVLRENYIKVAHSKGLGERTVICRHAIKNALLPAMKGLGLVIVIMLGAAPLIEGVFLLPGLGMSFVYSMWHLDYYIAMGTTLVLALLIIMANLIIDMVYGLLDPTATPQKIPELSVIVPNLESWNLQSVNPGRTIDA
jgi:peptide/nickel transport system permease protein